MDMMKMMKQAASMKKDMKKKQKVLASKTVEFSSGEQGVSIRMSCDLKPKTVEISPDLIQTGNTKKIETAVLDAMKGALNRAQAEAAEEMKSVTAGLDLPF